MDQWEILSLDSEIEHIRQSSRTIVRELGFFHKTFGKSSLTPAQGHLLLEIGKAKAMTQDLLASILNLNQSTASRNIKALIRHQLINITPEERDRRRKILSLTKKGVQELKLYNAEARKDVFSALEFLTEEQRTQCLIGLKLYGLALKKANLKKGGHHQLKLRLPHPNDLANEKINALTELINQVYDEAESGMWKRLGTRTTAKEVKRLLSKKELILADLDGMIVGLVRVQLLENKVGELGMLITHPDYQGIGIGSSLVRAAEDRARNHKCTTMQLELLNPQTWKHPRKESLKKWYKRLGYQPQFTEPFQKRNPKTAADLTTDCDFTIWHKSLSTGKEIPLSSYQSLRLSLGIINTTELT